jgi:uncharacterized phage protein gp47/JayE
VPSLLDLTVSTLDESLRSVKRGLTDAYSSYVTPAGKQLNAFVGDNFLFPLSEFYARLKQFLELKIREEASQATPFGATGANLDRFLEFKKVAIPSALTAQVTIEVTGDDAVLPSGSAGATIAGQRYSTDAVLIFPPGGATYEINATAEAVGTDSNMALGEILELDPVAGVSTAAPVVAILQVGADPADEDAKSRLLEAAFAGDAGVGTSGWYISQTLGLDGAFGDVFVLPAGYGVGSIVLYPLLALSAAEQQASPWLLKPCAVAQADAVTTVWADPTRRLVNDRVYGAVLATPAIDLEFTITPDTADTQAAVYEALRTRFADDYSASGYIISNSELIGAATTAKGVSSAILNDVLPGAGADADNVPVTGSNANIYALQGESLIVGVVTFS